VTVLTSIDEDILNTECGVPGDLDSQVLRLARLSADAGLDGIVCSALDLATLRPELDPGFTYVTPGIRGTTTPAGEDQKRVMSPGRAVAAGHTDGFVKIIRGKQYSEILGAHIVGPSATELIAEFVVGRHLESTVEELEKAMHPHPTLSEGVAEAALTALGRPIHI